MPIENYRVLSKNQAKPRRFLISTGPPTAPKATEVTQLLRRTGEREEEKRKKARFALLVFIFATLENLPETRLFIAGTFSQIQSDIYIRI